MPHACMSLLCVPISAYSFVFSHYLAPHQLLIVFFSASSQLLPYACSGCWLSHQNPPQTHPCLRRVCVRVWSPAHLTPTLAWGTACTGSGWRSGQTTASAANRGTTSVTGAQRLHQPGVSVVTWRMVSIASRETLNGRYLLLACPSPCSAEMLPRCAAVDTQAQTRTRHKHISILGRVSRRDHTRSDAHCRSSHLSTRTRTVRCH